VVNASAAETLFELLFDREPRRQAAPEPAPVQRAAPPRVKGPSYYTYKTDPLVRVDFAAIEPHRDRDAALHATSTSQSAEAAAPADGILVAQLDEKPSGGVVSDATEDTLPGNDTEAAAPVQAAPMPENPATDEAGASEPEQKESDTAAQEPAVDEPAAPARATASHPQPLTDAEIAGLQAFELLAEKEAAEAIVAHYSAVPEFIWISDGQVNERARIAMRTLADADSHGLRALDYAVAVPAGDEPAAVAAFEMELSARLLRYAHDARSGRVDPNRISGYHHFAPEPLDRVAMLQMARQSGDIAALLEAQHPRNERYKALRVELEALHASAEDEIVVAPDTLVRPGETDPEFDKILALILQRADDSFRAEHGETLTRNLGSDVYARELVPVVKAAQKAAGVGTDGVIGQRTVHALAGDSKAERIAKVEVALEQLRWLPSQLGPRHVFINTPAFNATYVEDGEARLSMRTIVGGLGTQTYFFQDKIEYVEFHPYWGVPRSILVNKYLPKLLADPSYLDRNGFEVVNSRGQQVSSASVNWGQYGANIPFDVRQRPGGGNALGELKIMFPNRHAIYMHDTPDKHLFDRDNRALSNGCVRLADPRAMAAAVLGWNREKLDARLAEPHSRANLDTKIPVYVAYFTAWPDASGTVQYFSDVYDRDARTRTAMEKVDALRSPAG
jgi:murein L,D-transpeptidase YcbB/YkuD